MNWNTEGKVTLPKDGIVTVTTGVPPEPLKEKQEVLVTISKDDWSSDPLPTRRHEREGNHYKFEIPVKNDMMPGDVDLDRPQALRVNIRTE